MSRELNRLVTAAVVNQSFCELLLDNPSEAITVGYDGDAFLLTAEEQDLVVSIQAVTLQEFVVQLLDLTQSEDDRLDTS